jgi:hypothetical protein
MAYGHAERNLALIRQLEAETRQLLESLDQPDAGQSAWLQTARLALPPPRMPAEDRWASTDQDQKAGSSSPSERAQVSECSFFSGPGRGRGGS